MYTKRVCISNRVPVSKKRLSSEGWMMAPLFFFFHLLSSDNVCCVCVRTHVCFYVHLCTRSYVKFPTSPPCLSVLRGFFYSFHLLPFHYSRKGFFMTHWCRITGLKSREAVLICHIHLLTSVLAVTYNSTGCDGDVWHSYWHKYSSCLSGSISTFQACLFFSISLHLAI